MHLLFDLDGTLTDPFPGITRSIQYALAALDRTPPPAEDLRWCIGPPLKPAFARLLDTSDPALLDTAIAKYRERFSTVGLFENEVYPGIPATLAALSQSGHTLFVATSKPGVYARRIVDHFGLAQYFRAIEGSELDGTRSDKAHLIAYLLEHYRIAPADAVMIGDREHDMIGAAKNHIAALGVLWGYGTRAELEIAGARACLTTPSDLPAAVLDLTRESSPAG